MRIFLLTVLVFPVVVLASDIYVTEVASPYAIVPVEQSINESQLHLGILDNFPVMYEFSLSSSTDFRARVSQPLASGSDVPHPFTVMLVRQDDRGGGVTEIARLTPTLESWSSIKDASVGASFWRGSELSRFLLPGTYRLEVSTPDNDGRYLLELGPEGDYGYFASVSRAWTIQQFLGYSPLRMLTSTLVYYPLGIILIGLLINRTWRYRKLISNAT